MRKSDQLARSELSFTTEINKCVGCHLCKLVCQQKAIDTALKRINKIECKKKD